MNRNLRELNLFEYNKITHQNITALLKKIHKVRFFKKDKKACLEVFLKNKEKFVCSTSEEGDVFFIDNEIFEHENNLLFKTFIVEFDFTEFVEDFLENNKNENIKYIISWLFFAGH